MAGAGGAGLGIEARVGPYWWLWSIKDCVMGSLHLALRGSRERVWLYSLPYMREGCRVDDASLLLSPENRLSFCRCFLYCVQTMCLPTFHLLLGRVSSLVQGYGAPKKGLKDEESWSQRPPPPLTLEKSPPILEEVRLGS